MAWKTKGGNFVNEGDKIVWLRKDKSPDWSFTGTVMECLPVNDDDDGEIRIVWDNNDGPETYGDTGRPRRWYYPFEVELVDKVNVLDRMVRDV